jgi:hypothetical protein
LGSISDFFSGLSSAAAAAKIIQSLLKNTRGTERSILLELRKNMDLLYLFLDDESKYKTVINKLDTRVYAAASERGFDFNVIKKGKVNARLLNDIKQLKPYAGWTTEELFDNIYLRINQLKNIVEIAPDDKNFRLSVRLKNLHKMMVLLVKHVRS